MYIQWVMLDLWEGTPARSRGKKSMAHQSAQFLPQVGREANFTSCSFAALPAEQLAKTSRQRPGWRGRKLGMPAIGGGDSGSSLEAPADSRRHRARHRRSLPGGEWGPRLRAQEGRFRRVPEPGYAGRGLRALVLSAPVRGLGVPQSRARVAGALWGAHGEDAREARAAMGGRGVVLLWPPGGLQTCG